MILFRQKYPRWWFDWNLELMRFLNRVGVYLSLLDDRYPSTDEQQCVMFDMPYPDAKNNLNRWLPLVKWILAIPHYVVLLFLGLAPSSSSSSRGSRSSSPAAIRAALSTSWSGSPAGTTASSGTRSRSSPTSTRRSASARSFRIPTARRAIIEPSYGPAGDGPSRTPVSLQRRASPLTHSLRSLTHLRQAARRSRPRGCGHARRVPRTTADRPACRRAGPSGS